MRHLIVALIFLMTSTGLFALEFSSAIHSISFGQGSEYHLIRFDNGRASFVKQENLELVSFLVLKNRNNEVVDVEIDKENILQSAKAVVPSSNLVDSDEELTITSSPYKPSVLKDWNSALRIFNQMRKNYTNNGECYNRAHVWSFEEYKRSNLNSMKIFMFFTESYIRRYRFHWWFHVTPATYVANLNSPRTLDRRYTTGPRQTKTWSNVFIRSQRTCKVVKKFDDFWLNQQKEDCYHIYASMYYVIPRDLEKRDLTGIEKTEFIESQLRRAYKNGFAIDMPAGMF